MFDSCLAKQKKVVGLFSSLGSEEEKYQKMMELGKEAPPIDVAKKISANLVEGCQSTTYLNAEFKNGKVYFEAESDALISAGLAALLVQVYSGEAPEVIIKCQPDYLKQIGIDASLTPSRVNGLYSMHLRMKQEAIKFLVGTRDLRDSRDTSDKG